MFMITTKRRHDKIIRGFNEKFDKMEGSRNAWRQGWFKQGNKITKLEAENMSLKAKLKAHDKLNKPALDKKTGRWRNPKTGSFVKAPDQIREA